MLLDLQHLPTSTLRAVVRNVLGRVVDSRTRCIHLLHSRGIFAISEDGSKYGLGEYHSTEHPSSRQASRERFTENLTIVEEPRSRGNKPPFVHIKRPQFNTDAAFDVMSTRDLYVTNDIEFQDLTNLQQELFIESKTRLEDIDRETDQMKADIAAFIDDLRVEPFGNQLVRIPLTNKLGTSHALKLSPASVKFNKPFFKCLRSDEFVFVSIECCITECSNVSVIEIDLPFYVRAPFVPFSCICKDTDEFSGMGRAYAKRGYTLYIESFLLQNITKPVYVNIHGPYLTRFSEPHRATPIKWVTPMHFQYPGKTELSTDMLTLKNTPADSDIGFHEGMAYFNRVDERVDMAMSVTFRQRTGVVIPRLSCVIDFPLTKDTLTHQYNVGYGSTYLPEYRTHVVKPPDVRLKQKTDQTMQFAIDAYVGYKPFHECTVLVNVTYFVKPLQTIHKFNKPVLTGRTSISDHYTINVSNIDMYDTHLFDTNKHALLDMYTLKINAVSELRNEYTEYTFTDLTLAIDSNLRYDRFEMSNIVLYNQLDQNAQMYLYPRSKLFHIKIRMLNKVDEYDGYDQPNGGYELLPDFTQ